MTDLFSLLVCPQDGGDLTAADDALTCATCAARHPIRDGVVSFVDVAELSEVDRREQSSRDDEASWYDSMFEGYTNAIEVPTVVRRLGDPKGPIVDIGSGTGRITEALLQLGQPVVALDYSEASLRTLLKRCADAPAPVLAVQADIRRLPLRDASFHGATSIQVYGHIRGADVRRRMLESIARALVPGAPFAVTNYNYNVLFRAWRLKGNEGAREGEHMLGGDLYYLRQTGKEFRAELAEVFDVAELVGMRNIPVRKVGAVLHKVGLRTAGDRYLEWMVERGHRLDMALERTPLSHAVGFFWLAKAVRRP